MQFDIIHAILYCHQKLKLCEILSASKIYCVQHHISVNNEGGKETFGDSPSSESPFFTIIHIGIEALENHVSTFIRKWLNNIHIYPERNLFYPRTGGSLRCEEEMVHTAITSPDIDQMKLVYECAQQV